MVNFASEAVVLSLTLLTELTVPQPGTVEIRRGSYTLRLKLLDPGVEAGLRRLADGPAYAIELEKAAIAVCPEADLQRLNSELARLAGRSLIQFSCVVAGAELLRATAEAPLAEFDFSPPPHDLPLCLSRFAYAHRTGDKIQLSSPASHTSVEVLDPALGALVFRLARPQTLAGLAGELPACEQASLCAAAGFLFGAGVLAGTGPSGEPIDETQPGLAQRDFHDVALHAASRSGLTSHPIGGTYRFQGTFPPEPALKPLPDGPRIALPRPDMDQIVAEDPPLAQVMESRRSIRDFTTAAVTVGQLGEFLFRVARVKSVRGLDEGFSYEMSRRTYPSGGACYDLEFYLTVRRCSGLAPAIYHYDPAGHQLTLIRDDPDLVRRMLLDAYIVSGKTGEPQILITLASRFARLAWKYEGIAYAATLKNVGVLQEAMYLAAGAMGLAPCALGTGDSALFATVTGLDPLVESSVGEFMLGLSGDR